MWGRRSARLLRRWHPQAAMQGHVYEHSSQQPQEADRSKSQQNLASAHYLMNHSSAKGMFE